jgi:hypothetical protein
MYALVTVCLPTRAGCSFPELSTSALQPVPSSLPCSCSHFPSPVVLPPVLLRVIVCILCACCFMLQCRYHVAGNAHAALLYMSNAASVLFLLLCCTGVWRLSIRKVGAQAEAASQHAACSSTAQETGGEDGSWETTLSCPKLLLQPLYMRQPAVQSC